MKPPPPAPEAVANFRRLYLHVPFCRSKCGYCAFHSVAATAISAADWDDAQDAYLDNLRRRLPPMNEVRSVYIGGGTPSQLGPRKLEALFGIIRERVRLADGAEMSIEFNPEDVAKEPSLASIALAGGATRVSLGAQSFQQEALDLLGRNSTPQTFAKAWDTMRAAGLGNLSLDLIYGIPGQSLHDWERELRAALAFEPRHLSAYALTPEEGAAIFQHLPAAHPPSRSSTSRHPCHHSSTPALAASPIANIAAAAKSANTDDELLADMWSLAGDILATAGLQRYEVSNYAVPGSECEHNLDIWLGDTYLGVGPAAASFDGENRWTEPGLYAWLRHEPPELDVIEPSMRHCEVFAVGLRSEQGWPPGLFQQRRGVPLEALRLPLDKWEAAGLALRDGRGRVRLTPQGLLLWNEIAETIIFH